ncbi:MAG: hypothetical protein AAFV19_20375 [Pseudomonadota bacterium]
MPRLNEPFRDNEFDQLVFVLPEDDGDPELPPPPEPAAPEREEIDDYTAELRPDFGKPEWEEIDDYTAELLPDFGKPQWEEIDHYTTERPLEDEDDGAAAPGIKIIIYEEYLPL